MDQAGIQKTGIHQVDDVERVRRLPSLQLEGSRTHRFSDLNRLMSEGVEIVGRLSAIRDGQALFSGALANHCALSDLKMNRLLETLDDWAESRSVNCVGPVERFAPTRITSYNVCYTKLLRMCQPGIILFSFTGDLGALHQLVRSAS